MTRHCALAVIRADMLRTMTNVVLVSGGAAVTPFTTPAHAAATGLAAGNTMTALRSRLLREGLRVFTAPAGVGAVTVAEDTGWQGFADTPVVLPQALTVNSVGTLDQAGATLHAFLQYLAAEHGVTDAVLVAHSMGGLFSRAAIAQSTQHGSAVSIQGLITIGTPWTGSLLGDYRAGSITLNDARGDHFTEQVLTRSAEFARANSQGAADQVSAAYLTGPTGWNAQQAGMLDAIPVTVLAGSYFATFNAPETVWTHDGLVGLRSASAVDVPSSVLPKPDRATFPDVHSIFFAAAAGLPWERALTWDPEVADAITIAVQAYGAQTSD